MQGADEEHVGLQTKVSCPRTKAILRRDYFFFDIAILGRAQDQDTLMKGLEAARKRVANGNIGAARMVSGVFMGRSLREMPSAIRLRLVSTLFGRASNVFMVAFAAVVCGATVWIQQHSISMALTSVCEVALLIARCGIIIAFKRSRGIALPQRGELWLAPFGLLAVGSSCCWGAMCFNALTTARAPIVYMLPVICTVGTAGAIAARNSGVPRLAQMQLGCSLSPLLAGCAFAADDSLRMLLLLVPAMTLGLLVLVSERHAQFVELIKTQAALENLSNTDALTQVANRRAFDVQLRLTCIPDSTVSLIMIDVDRFKTFNDRHGHVAGDVLLKQIATTLKKGLGTWHQCIARFGGEEFTVVLAGVGSTEAHAVAERLRQGVAFECRDPTDGLPITISLGIATVSNGDSVDLLARADTALYQAKKTGRNRIVASEFAIAA